MADCVPRDRRRRGLAYRFGLGAAFRQQKRQTLLDVRLGFGQAAKKSRGMSGLSTDLPAHGNHEQRRGRLERDRGHDESRARRHADDEAVPARNVFASPSRGIVNPMAEPDPQTQTPATEDEPRGERVRRRTRRAGLYTWAFLLVALLVVLVALIIANTREVEVSWVFGSTSQSLVWIILAAAIVGWLTGIVTSVLFRRRTRRGQ